MAIFHLSVKSISRGKGRSATGAAAYRSGEKIIDRTTGIVHDYTKKAGVDFSQIILPENAPPEFQNRSELWNAAEAAENRKNSMTAREIVIALPAELSAEERQKLAIDFTTGLVKKHGFAADVCIHQPDKDGDNKNHHAHILLSTRKVEKTGFTKKTRELDTKNTSGKIINNWREDFAKIQNDALEKAGRQERVDNRTLAAQGIDRTPQKHLGPSAAEYEKRTGQKSRIRIDWETLATERLAAAKAAGDAERELEKEIQRLEKDLDFYDGPNRAKRDFEKLNNAIENGEDLSAYAAEMGIVLPSHRPHPEPPKPEPPQKITQGKTQEVAKEEKPMPQLYVPDWLIYKEMQNGKHKTRQPNTSRTRSNDGSGLFGLPELNLDGLERRVRSSGAALVLSNERSDNETPGVVRREDVHASDARAAEPETTRKLTLNEKQYNRLLATDTDYAEKVRQDLKNRQQPKPSPKPQEDPPKPPSSGGWSGPS